MAGKTPELSRNGHELAPLNNRANASDNPRKPGVTIVLQGPRGSIISRGSQMATDGGDGENAAWSGKLQFFLTIIGYSVGLGNIWRFPYLCQKNGGGAFLIPFAIMLICEGIPLFLIELGIGQKMRLGSLGVWNTIHPWLGGIGISSCIVTFFVALYYNVIITWCFYYVFNSFRNPLPWDKCPEFNNITVPECAKSSATKYFWYRVTLDSSPAIDQPGEPKWWIVLCLLLSWIVVFFIVMKGIQSSGKVVYFTSLFPYVVLTIFLIKGLSLDGAADGLKHMLKPKVNMLLEPGTWLDAATQVFYSFGLAFGSLIAFGSYNTPKNNCVRDVILVSICNAFTAIYASIVIFAILGFKALKSFEACQEMNPYKNCSLEDELNTAAQGTGLAFVVFTEAIVNLPFPPIWAVLFFLMLLSLGIGSQIGIIEGMLCTIFDIEILKRVSKQYITATVCTICFFIGIIFTTGAGEYWLSMFDSFAGTIGLVVVALMEMIAVIYVYGHEKFTKDIHEMTGVKPGLYWQITWRFLAPAIMIVILFFSVGSMIIEHPKYTAWNAEKGITQQTDYPGWVLGVAAAMVLIGVLPIPIVFLLRRYQILKMDINIHEGSIRRIDTTVSTKEMITDVDLDDDDEEAYQNGPLSIYDESSSSDNDDIKDIRSLSLKSAQSRRTTTPAQSVSRSFRMNLNED